ncbi:hypothetical protein J2S40_003805 [Nocardioides luteus]|uniref:Uncharacterized protein n=1 Tax=Nocardioides luteus TaxID=1844 RepID=A0ABQ5SZW7_9ACTN|nr:hypothetical protein [Nocardioides luteus]MDR7312747.1 hypothetical protein [Nocardioides luteus]GGR47275.1 hypothetical protein GCM10010197_11350 [Nocardioides luteus]GLJ68999.1 hypothetical protein GCM10017579_30350 [Nocardioides luteus]
MRLARGGLVLVGTAGMAYGAWLLLSRQDLGQIAEVVVWLAAAVVIHDGLLAPAVLGLGWVGGRLLPRPVARGAVTVLVLLGPILLVAVPVVGRFGAKADNPTLLDRDYVQGLVAVAVLCVCAGVAVALGELRSPQRADEEE